MAKATCKTKKLIKVWSFSGAKVNLFMTTSKLLFQNLIQPYDIIIWCKGKQ